MFDRFLLPWYLASFNDPGASMNIILKMSVIGIALLGMGTSASAVACQIQSYQTALSKGVPSLFNAARDARLNQIVDLTYFITKRSSDVIAAVALTPGSNNGITEFFIFLRGKEPSKSEKLSMALKKPNSVKPFSVLFSTIKPSLKAKDQLSDSDADTFATTASDLVKTAHQKSKPTSWTGTASCSHSIHLYFLPVEESGIADQLAGQIEELSEKLIESISKKTFRSRYKIIGGENVLNNFDKLVEEELAEEQY